MVAILIADDQLVMRNMFKTILQEEGHELTLVVDGEAAYAAAKAKQYHMVITDFYMPKLNGIELTTKLRRLSMYVNIPILIVSTEGHVNKKNEGKAAGATGWIVKPISGEKLLPVLRQLYSKEMALNHQ